MSDRTGQRLGNYRLLRLLGKGGFAEVYLGEHTHLVTQAAIKVLLAHLGSQTDVEGFRREAQTIARLTHPHIVRVLDFDVEQGVPFLVMEYAPHGSLRARHPRGQPLPLPLICSYVQQVASALQYAHEYRLIHRDVKPDNMLLREDGSVVLSDFGIVIIAHSSSSRGIEAMAGTAAYMPPEQMQGQPRPASDQYALAVSVYEWISGKPPFQGTAMEVAMQNVLKPPPSLVEQVAMLPPFVEQVVFTALAKDPKERFPTVQAFATALALAVQSEQDVSTFIKPGNPPKAAPLRESTPRAARTSPTEPGTVAAPPTQPQPTRESRITEPGREQTDARRRGDRRGALPPSHYGEFPVPASLAQPARSSPSQGPLRRGVSRRVLIGCGIVLIGVTLLILGRALFAVIPHIRPPATLQGSDSTIPAMINLSAEGTLDWAHWGLPPSGHPLSTDVRGPLHANSFCHKTGANLISDFTLAYASTVYWFDSYKTYSWRDGSPISQASTNTGVYILGSNNQFLFTVGADTTLRTLRIYWGLQDAVSKLTAHLSDNSAPDYIDTELASTDGAVYEVTTISYRAASSSQTLTITLATTGGVNTSNISLQAVTLADT